LSDFPPFWNRKTLIFRDSVMAEGVVSEPFLPSGDQDRKVGFAPLSKQHPILCRITNKMQAEIRFFSATFGCKTEGELGNAQKLGTRLDAAQQVLLAETQNPAALSLLIYRTLFHPSWAMLPFCDRRVIVPREGVGVLARRKSKNYISTLFVLRRGKRRTTW
jgi:hypothetical protein